MKNIFLGIIFAFFIIGSLYLLIEKYTVSVDKVTNDKRVLLDIEKTEYKNNGFKHRHENTYTFFISGTNDGFETHNYSYGNEECEISPETFSLIKLAIGQTIDVEVEHYSTWFSDDKTRIKSLSIRGAHLIRCVKETPLSTSGSLTIKKS